MKPADLRATQRLHEALLSYENDGANEPDARRMISEERQALYMALSRHEIALEAYRRTGEDRFKRALALAESKLSTVAAEARRVAKMWGVPW